MSTQAGGPVAPVPAGHHAELATRLASRLCHDFAGPIGGVLSGVELLTDAGSPIPADDALALVQESARTLSSQLAFARVAFGSGDEPFASEDLVVLARNLFETIRPTLEWDIAQVSMPSLAARVLLNLVQLGGVALPVGGVVRPRYRREGELHLLTVEAVGARAVLHPEVAAGLAGEGRGEGLAGRWVQGAFVNAVVYAGGGELHAENGDGLVKFTARLPG